MRGLENLQWLFDHSYHRGNKCLIWPFSKVRGYGQVGVGDRRIKKAHRIMCEIVHGSPPSPHHEAAHSCGNSACVNPKHLSWKTRSKNQTDSVAMGRYYTGGRRGKLNTQKAMEIRALKGLMSQDQIAKKFRVSHSTVGKIHRGETWMKSLTCR